MISGSIVAMVTPFNKGQVDFKCLENLIQWHIDQGTNGLVLCGSTGEGLLLSLDEWSAVMQASIQYAQRKIPIIAGVSQASPLRALEYLEKASKLKVDAALVVTPFYVKPSQEGMYAYYKELHDHSDLPIILYNNPARCIVDLSVETILELSKLPRIIGLKDSNTDLSRPRSLRSRLGPSFTLLAGEDSMFPEYLKNGGDGGILVVGNIIPQACAKLIISHQSKAFDQSLADWILNVVDSLEGGANPIPIKAATHLIGKCSEELRLPLLPLLPSLKEKLKDKLEKLGVIDNVSVHCA